MLRADAPGPGRCARWPRCAAGGRPPAAAYASAAARYPDRAGARRRARHAHLRGGRTGAPTRSRASCARAGHRRRRRRGDHVPQPPRLHRGDRRLLEARRQRAVPEHRLRRPADHRRARARGPRGGDLRRGVRRAGARRARRARCASSPGASPGRRARRRPAARGADRARATTSELAAARARAGAW